MSSRAALGCRLMPKPRAFISTADSQTRTSMPAACRLSAAVSPPMPAPTIVTCMTVSLKIRLSIAACTTPHGVCPDIRLLERDLSAADDLRPGFGFGSQACNKLRPRLRRHLQSQRGVVLDDRRTADCVDQCFIQGVENRVWRPPRRGN